MGNLEKLQALRDAFDKANTPESRVLSCAMTLVIWGHLGFSPRYVAQQIGRLRRTIKREAAYK